MITPGNYQVSTPALTRHSQLAPATTSLLLNSGHDVLLEGVSCLFYDDKQARRSNGRSCPMLTMGSSATKLSENSKQLTADCEVNRQKGSDRLYKEELDTVQTMLMKTDEINPTTKRIGSITMNIESQVNNVAVSSRANVGIR